MKNKRVQFILFSLLFSQIMLSTIIAQASVTINGSEINTIRKTLNPTTYIVDPYHWFDFYYESPSMYEQRSMWNFTIPTSIPQNSIVYKVELSYYCSQSNEGTQNFCVNYVPNFPSNPTYQQIYDLANTGTNVGTFYLSYTNQTSVVTQLVSIIQNALNSSSNSIALGVYAPNNEYTSGCFGRFNLNIYYYRPVNFSISNNFNAGSVTVNGISRSSGYSLPTLETSTATLTAVEPQTNIYTYIWNDTEAPLNKSNWARISTVGTTDKGQSQTLNFAVTYDDNGSNYVANMRKKFSVTFQNNFIGISSAGVININGTQYNAPSYGNLVIEGNNITAEAPQQTINGIIYNFSSWSNGSTSYSITVTPIDHTIYVANYIGKPNNSNFSFAFDLTRNQPIKMHWTDNPNSNVTYQIWRCKTMSRGVAQDPVQLATVQKGVQTYTDDDYLYTGLNTDATIYYSIKEYYSVEGTVADFNWLSTKGEMQPKVNAYSSSIKACEIEDYSVICYPNPFNPATTIEYQLPADGFVSLKVYDMLGREVKTLVNDIKTKGRYSIRFDATNMASGIYIYQLKANGFSSIKKMVLTK
ncbi:MAG: T9SS type A sorting domain-containing protein [Ignavibacteriaceae bacterium]|nr:T9SS type A sorting domain-containing protein [Ignavibacteriaceae bacterium]